MITNCIARPHPVVKIRTLLLALIAAALVFTPVAPAQAALGDGQPTTAADLAPVPGSILFGFHMNPDATAAHLGLAPGSLTNQGVIESFETTMDRKMDLHRIFLSWDSQVPQTAIDSVARQRTPILSFSAYRTDDTPVLYTDIASGALDADIQRHANQVAALGVPIYLTFQHEPDMATLNGTPAEYVAAWRHYVTVFRAAGVTNVVWNWIMTPSSFGSRYVGAGAEAYYPGNDVVDIVALDAYNWYGCSAGKPTSWRPMSTIALPFRNFGIAKAKPLMFAEWGSAEDPADPTRKPAWIRETMATFLSWPEVKAVSYFNTTGNCEWWLDSSAATTDAFREIAASTGAHGRANATLEVDTEHGPGPLAVTLTSSSSAGAGFAKGQGVASWTLDFGDGATPLSGTGTPPGALTHVYDPGVYSATLSMTDVNGRVATDTRVITSVGAPTVTGSETSLATTSVDLNTWTNGEGIPTTLTYEWGTSTAYGNTSAPVEMPLVNYATKNTLPLTGLTPGTKYYWRASATNEGGTTVLERSFTTPAKPLIVEKGVSSLTATSARFTTTVSPFGLSSSARHEWKVSGSSTLLGSKSYSFAATTGTKWILTDVTGLAPRTTYSYRTVATNAIGTSYSAWTSFTTPAS